MKNAYYSNLEHFTATGEGANQLLEYFASFSRQIFGARDFKTILSVFHSELRKIYPDYQAELIISHHNQRPVKFVYDRSTRQAVPAETLNGQNNLYNYVLSKRQVVLTNNYRRFCENLGVEAGALEATAWVGIPLEMHGKMIGALVMWHGGGDRYLRLQDKQFLSSMANMVSFAIENTYLHNYLAEKNGSLQIFDNLPVAGKARNSIKSVLRQLLDSVVRQPQVQYTALFLGIPGKQKWRMLDEGFRDPQFGDAGIDLLLGLAHSPLEIFEAGQDLFWRRENPGHPLNEVLSPALDRFPVGAGLFFPFVLNNTYLGVWLVAFDRHTTHLNHDEVQLYRFIFYLMTQLIEKKSLLEQTQKYESYLKHLERMKTLGELAGNTAHHLNNILSVIIGKGQLLQKRLKESTQFRDLELILQAAKDGAASIQRLQNFSARKKSGKTPQTINLNALVQEVVDIARPRFEDEAQLRGIHYDLELNLGDIKPVSGNSHELREVILNLINNALDAMPRGGKLSIQTTLKEQEVLIFISDTGIGIPHEIREKIFEKFYTTKGKQGNGLGLSIARDIVQRHRGTIYVDSIPHKGSIFLIELPASSSEIVPHSPARPAFYQPLGYKVLLVEDEGIVRETLAEMLEDEGCEVYTASDAREALLKFKKHQCDAVFADLSMPHINGIELAGKLKQLNPHIPVLIVTGWNQLDQALPRSEGLIDGMIKKPFNIELIRQELVRVVGRGTPFHKNGFSV
ncbi:MAG: response regulator [Calditrichaeota bacterium]|nr:response regulator [Calditrichota bacterium]MCB0303085.1 response regulator [Calditrichota bacterium]MCB9088380.1 response regulator [Calditrichia bacterium]